ncbi:uncharacterized protein [Periplaneta americana]|uniref:uncharacterized protein isoform X1 n=2 Tax=Periplaneta americana TaxID=6978 RepID=UPI0037E772D0
MTQAKSVTTNVGYYHSYEYSSLQQLQRRGKMHGARRVIMFCLLTAVLPTILLVIPLYLRHSVYADVTYAVAESDVLEIVDGISTVFCQSHSLKMNSSFHAFQLSGLPELSSNRKHIRLKKSMSLPDDTLEYWGFYLLKGSTVVLSVCSRFQGSRVMVVKGEKNLKTCGLLDHKKEGAVHPHMASGQGHVRVTFDTEAQEIHSRQQPTELKPSAQQLRDEDFEGEDVSDGNVSLYENFAVNYIEKHYNVSLSLSNETEAAVNGTVHLRHARKRQKDLDTELQSNKHNKSFESRVRRNVQFSPTHLLDGGVEHGGNAGNLSNVDRKESSVSSFENNLLTCYDGQILLAQSFLPSPTCTGVHAIDSHGTMETVHEVVADGYYYYIFYSDNDFVQNDIHAIFDIHKPTYQYAKHARSCYNKTECTFPISFWSDEIVIVEVPTRDGIEHEEDDITFLVSSCYPRMSVYIIFPVAVLFLILGCAFM